MDDPVFTPRRAPCPAGDAGKSGLSLHLLQSVPEEEVWLNEQRSPRTRRAYRADVSHFVATLNIQSREDLRRVGRAAVVAWMKVMELRGERPRTVRRRLAALSSLFRHLVAHDLADGNPVREIRRPAVDRKHGTTPAFSAKEARRILDAPDPLTLAGRRDRALLSVGFQVGLRRAEIASLRVKDLYTNLGYKSLRYFRKGNLELSVSINPQTAQRIEEYLALAGHGFDDDGPLFRPLRGNQHATDLRRHLAPLEVQRILLKHVNAVGIARGYSAHSMRATFITTALTNGADIEDVQRDVGHADISTTKLYDRRGHSPDRSASFFATY